MGNQNGEDASSDHRMYPKPELFKLRIVVDKKYPLTDVNHSRATEHPSWLSPSLQSLNLMIQWITVYLL
jgi:hypothetical protein